MTAEHTNGDGQTLPPTIKEEESDSANERVIEIEGNRFTPIKEGLAFILVPETQKNVGDQERKGAVQNVFYNPIQQFNRDLSVLAIKIYGEDAMTQKKAKFAAWSKTQAKQKEQRAEHDSKKRKRGHEDPMKDEKFTAEPASTSQIHTKTKAKWHQAAKEPEDSKDVTGSSTYSGIAPAKGPQFSILDALSATGLRALRYAQEIPFATRIVANDLSPDAAKSIQKNVVFNNLIGKIKAHQSNAVAHMYGFFGSKGSLKYDVIDLDPYGTAGPFLDAAVQAVTDGGLLCVTCTDAGVFASVGYPEKTYALYGGIPLKGSHCHEAGLRLILHAIGTAAARHGRSIEPLLSLSIDFYARVFVRIRTSPAEVKMLAGKTMIVYNCDQGCGAWTTQPLSRHRVMQDKKGGEFYKFGLIQAPQCSEHCLQCGHKTHLAGPMFGGPLHSPSFVRNLLYAVRSADETIYGTKKRMEGMLSTALEEALLTDVAEEPENTAPSTSFSKTDPAEIDIYPFFFVPHALSRVLHCQTPPEVALRGALKHAGYRVARSHTKAGSLKTDAPWSVIWTIMRAWVRQKSPVKEGALREGTAGWRIMQGGTRIKRSDIAASRISREENKQLAEEEDEEEVVFDEKLGDPGSTKGKLVRYQINPRANWGPMTRAKAEQKGE